MYADIPPPTGAGDPWILLAAVSHTGAGIFSDVTSLQRINTSGGGQPEAACDATTGASSQQSVAGASDFYYYYTK